SFSAITTTSNGTRHSSASSAADYQAISHRIILVFRPRKFTRSSPALRAPAIVFYCEIRFLASGPHFAWTSGRESEGSLSCLIGSSWIPCARHIELGHFRHGFGPTGPVTSRPTACATG